MQFALETADGVNGRGGFTAPVLENGGLMKSIRLIRIAATGLLLVVASANLPAMGRLEATMEERFDSISALVESTRGLTYGQRVSIVTEAAKHYADALPIGKHLLVAALDGVRLLGIAHEVGERALV